MWRRSSYSKSKSSKSVRPSKSFRVTKYNTALPIIVISILYIGCSFFAKSAPVFVILQQIGSFVYGSQGMLFVVIALLLYGLLARTKPWLIASWGRQFFVLSIFISALINMNLLDAQRFEYTKYGWYISAPLLEIGKLLFATNTMVIQWVIVIGLLVTIIWILMSTNIELPLLPSVRLHMPDKPTTTHQLINNPSSWSKITWETYKKTASQRKDNNQDGDTLWSDSWLKTLLKSKLMEKLGRWWSHWWGGLYEWVSLPKPVISFPKDKPTFGVGLLHTPDRTKGHIDELYITAKADLIKAKLAEFGIQVEIAWYNIWPSVVQIKLQPQSGVKYSAIEWLKNDLMWALKSKTLRILAPIVWTEFVGIEISNPQPSIVRLSEVLGSTEFTSSMNDNLTNLSLGKGIDGKLVIKSLESMPHLLIAWATWQGKSVWVNDFILSLMYQNTPNELRFIMVDPKQVEMELYSGLPYLLCPIITDPEKALRALKRATVEMDTRYGMLKALRVKNLDEYNAKVVWLPIEEQTTYQKLHRIVIVVDELADLMMSGKKKDVELCITRIAQKARAVGMHLIVATQRPSVNVITWLIKANMPTRISFGVVSQIDSRTILDMKGAEDLIGRWDMLYVDPTTRHPIRIQAPFVDTPEIEEVVHHLKKHYMKWLDEQDIYDSELTWLLDGSGIGSMGGMLLWWGWGDHDSDDETLVQQAIEIISKSRRASTTAIQRHLKIWFARAWRVMDILEERGIVWPQEWGRPREVLI